MHSTIWCVCIVCMINFTVKRYAHMATDTALYTPSVRNITATVRLHFLISRFITRRKQRTRTSRQTEEDTKLETKKIELHLLCTLLP